MIHPFVFAAAIALGGQPQPPAPTPPGPTPAPATPAPPAAVPPAKPADGQPAPMLRVETQAVDPKVDDLLTRLETADQSLKSLTAQIKFFKVFPEISGGEAHVRDGTLTFGRRTDSTGISRRMFAVKFTSLIVDGKLRNRDLKEYTFDGEVLIEREPNAKPPQFQRQRLVAPGSPTDPLRLGEGRVQFPMPLGQKKADILSRFDVAIAPSLENVDPKSAKLQQVLADTRQIRMVPKPGTVQARDFVEIRIWYRPSDLLPLFAQSVNTDGSKAEVLLEDLKPNAEVPAGAFDTRAPDPKEGWQGKNEDSIQPQRQAETPDRR